MGRSEIHSPSYFQTLFDWSIHHLHVLLFHIYFQVSVLRIKFDMNQLSVLAGYSDLASCCGKRVGVFGFELIALLFESQIQLARNIWDGDLNVLLDPWSNVLSVMVEMFYQRGLEWGLVLSTMVLLGKPEQRLTWELSSGNSGLYWCRSSPSCSWSQSICIEDSSLVWSCSDSQSSN